MSNFEIAVDKLLKLEGGFVDNPADNGGATNYGISLRFLKSIQPTATVNDIKTLNLLTAMNLYKKYFWDAYKIGQINDQGVAEKVFDMFVNMNPKSAALIVQKSINFLFYGKLTEDCIIGEKTIQAINNEVPGLLLQIIRLNCVRHYVSIADKDKSQRQFFFGWVKNRALL